MFDPHWTEDVTQERDRLASLARKAQAIADEAIPSELDANSCADQAAVWRRRACILGYLLEHSDEVDAILATAKRAAHARPVHTPVIPVAL